MKECGISKTKRAQDSECKDHRYFGIPRWLRNSEWATRWVLAFLLYSLFLLIVWAGHVYCAIFVLVLITKAYYELVSLPEKMYKTKSHVCDEKPGQTKLTRSDSGASKRTPKRVSNYFFSKSLDILSFISLKTYFLLTTMLGICVPWIMPRMMNMTSQVRGVCVKILSYHYMVTFIFILLGMIKFILSLERGKCKIQFLQFAIIVVSLLYVVSQSLMIIANLYFGMLWFLLPHTMIILNDTMAYLFGKALGKHPLISLSPNKTVEGFIGGAISTVLIITYVSAYLLDFKPLICPMNTFDFTPFAWTQNTCEIAGIYSYHELKVPEFLSSLIGHQIIRYRPCFVHIVVLSIFASLFAPFGGFLASGFKRALKIKDFSDTIPGHGGLMDRFDCQVLMGTFTYLYLKTFARSSKYSAEAVLKQIVKLPAEEQLEVLQGLKAMLS